MIDVVLVSGASAAAREAAVGAAIDADPTTDTSIAVLLEGLSDGIHPLESRNFSNSQVTVQRIASGCLCCTNNMIMRVYLNRIISRRPGKIYLCVSSTEHLPQIEQFLSGQDYTKKICIIDKVNVV